MMLSDSKSTNLMALFMLLTNWLEIQGTPSRFRSAPTSTWSPQAASQSPSAAPSASISHSSGPLSRYWFSISVSDQSCTTLGTSAFPIEIAWLSVSILVFGCLLIAKLMTIRLFCSVRLSVAWYLSLGSRSPRLALRCAGPWACSRAERTPRSAAGSRACGLGGSLSSLAPRTFASAPGSIPRALWWGWRPTWGCLGHLASLSSLFVFMRWLILLIDD